MIIDGVKYKDIFKLVYFEIDKNCFICKNKIKVGIDFYESNIYSDRRIITPIYVCTNCVKTSTKAEEIIIPLVKIMYGGKIKVKRYRINNDGSWGFCYDKFYY